MSIIEKAQELGDLISNSQELEAIKKAEEAMYNDSTANELIQEFQKKQVAANNAHMNGEEVSEDLMKELEEIQNKMQDNALISNYLDAQDKFNQILQSVNYIISKALNGGDDCDCGSDCSSGCGGGCC